MAIKIYKPTSPGRRIHSVTDYSVLRKRVKAPNALIVSKKKTGGRNNRGLITTRHQGGGHKQKVRMIDFMREKLNIPAKVQTLEYDPGRSAFISLLAYRDGEKRYILAPDGVKVGTILLTAPRTEVKVGNRMMLKNIPVGTNVHSIEILAGRGGQIARAAGNYAIISASEGEHVLLKMPSGEIRKVAGNAYATLGQVSNVDWMYVRIGKAGRTRHMGIRPSVRGKAMNPVDHPHGGGEGHNPIGLKYPKTPWGKHALGVRTRNPKRASSRFIVKRRSK
ncbi:MAG: 50S ribosomal protein L2 [Candidatus Doudnabacteria bacterium RIFCSPHIGHO2_02_FULL_42_25]|uniref:Large ribosomal subunit protein uL2 n=1 Tax=Candidatus Doudnabacteria bacterium RIFCSPHIGHO2_01_FULL_41_86 TaxID=1817821 RepID=A0A1F5N9J6_9BACT|nr:ribosomal protein L2 [uncultured bacterium]OGE74243.1 MAG: 50S ribosomal protein L2 [Candidatus Doudnabacteria bacterium RIFCSPHIGHO2_01_FULL_41_86]OGE75011.1 MAG: 50S ribosomal protein L2 [Candidatus Doudnabacteria bacterium RIFCSPHIGHO2_01_43_10]OGE85282.1 MAG: 50S ribosomal protein L2 [Candidatus Doudnabacteria bacterium RIFCSPHIGHO2_12_FULL_42_22]OGE86820.1 MAG: 50S ribosomal protein L2 [Candidatus Doudnabacteria bacterium RIFCSPHIGHO2_02_FULL_42_25]OGE92419.1 MAG: 50S ribosomal protein